MINSKSNTRNLNMKLKHLISLVLLIALIGTAAPAGQEYENWTDFNVNSTSALTDYQVSIILDNRTGTSSTTLFYTNGTTLSDWMDIKWTDTSNTTLGFWKENRTDTTTNTTWWIKVPSIANDNTTKIRLFYGNASETTSYADGDATFPLFDDFPGTSLNTSKWDTTIGTNTISNSVLNLTGFAASSYDLSKTTFGTGYATTHRSNRSNWGSPAGSFLTGFRSSPPINNFSIFYAGWPVGSVLNGVNGKNTGTYPSVTFTYPSANVFHILTVIRNGTTSIIYSIDGISPKSTTTYITSSSIPVIIGIDGSAPGSTIFTDWVFVRKYNSPEPFLTLNSAPVASFTLNRNPTRIPNSITATDTSTNTPTSWEWSWGDGTANSTTQNPSHQYLKRGKWDIVLTATNAGGSGTTGATSVKVVGYENYY